MSAWCAVRDVDFGPYTVLDLHDLPEGGKGFELEDGWLVERAAGARHNFVGWSLARKIERELGTAAVIVCGGGGWEVGTPAGVRKPDIALVPYHVARSVVADESPKPIPGIDLLLVAEVVSPGSGSERADRVRKVREYAELGIPQYWIIEHRPKVRIHRGILDGATYRWEPTVTEGQEFTAEIEADKTIRVAFDPAVLIDI